MSCGKCGGRCSKGGLLCPLSLGLGLGFTLALSVYICSVWMVYKGIPPILAAQLTAISWGDVWMFSLMGFIKGFIFGIFLALFYDFFVCIKHMCSRCCHKRCDKCGSSCNCSGTCKCGSVPKHNETEVK